MKFLKGLLITVLVLFILVAVPVTAVLVAVSDRKDETPLELYRTLIDENTDEKTVLGPLIARPLEKMGENYALDFVLDEETLNKLLFLVAKKENEKYDPENGEYLLSYDIPENIPLVAGKKLIVKSCYARIEDGTISVFAPAEAAGLIKTKLSLSLAPETTENDYAVKITSLKFGKINLLSGMGRKILNTAIGDNFKETTESDFPFEIDFDAMKLICKKEKLGTWLKEKIGDENKTAGNFVSLIFKRNLISFSSENKEIKLSVDLKDLKPESLPEMKEKIKEPFEFESFLKAKTQMIAVNMLTADDMKISFTETEFERMIYTETEAYSMFKAQTEFFGKTITFKVDQIKTGIDDINKMFSFEIVLNINGMITVLKAECPYEEEENEKEIKIRIPEEISFGNLTVDSDIITSVFGERLGIMPFNREEKSFLLSEETFIGFIGCAEAETQLHFSKMKFLNHELLVFVGIEDEDTKELIDRVTDNLGNVLSEISNAADDINFNTSDPEEETAVEALKENLETVAEKISNETDLSENDTSGLLDAFDNLSEENKNLFIEQIQNRFEAEGEEEGNDFRSLYEKLFDQIVGEEN